MQRVEIIAPSTSDEEETYDQSDRTALLANEINTGGRYLVLNDD